MTLEPNAMLTGLLLALTIVNTLISATTRAGVSELRADIAEKYAPKDDLKAVSKRLDEHMQAGRAGAETCPLQRLVPRTAEERTS